MIRLLNMKQCTMQVNWIFLGYSDTFSIMREKLLSSTTKIFIFSFIFLAFFGFASAQTTKIFTKDLYWNMGPGGTVQVKLLQEFLLNQGVYSGPISGVYLSQT